ncbi:MAG: type II secretion system protein GspN [Deltaproteobacteria bacterium]|nr:type II secretion system protein GspN [Deltaproteobacteria bacterium]
MTEEIYRIIGRIGYVTYFLIITFVLLYYRFPSNEFNNYFQTKINNLFPSYRISTLKTTVSIPYGLKIYKIVACPANNPETPVFTADQMIIMPVIRSFFRKGIDLDINCEAYGGNITGVIHIPADSSISYQETMLDIRNLNLPELLPSSGSIENNIIGILNGSITLKSNIKDPLQISGEANINIKDTEIRLREPVFGLGHFELNAVSAKIILRNRRADVNDGRFNSDIMRGSFSGNIQLNDNLQDSTLDLKGSIEPFAAFLKELESSGKITGSLRKYLQKGALSFTLKGRLNKYKIKI